LTQSVEVRVSPDLLERILELAGTDMILVGGQALAFWAAYYYTTAPSIAITKDVDLLGTRADVERLAHGLGGKAVFPHKNEMTLLVGQVMKDLPGGDYVNIDVMFRVYGGITDHHSRSVRRKSGRPFPGDASARRAARPSRECAWAAC
jgi:hypothetical protein